MPLERLYLKDFRLFQEHNFSFTEGTNLILGKNGSGKTSILESLNILLTGKSFRAKDTKECIQTNKNSFVISGKGNLGTKHLNLKAINSLEGRLVTTRLLDTKKVKKEDLYYLQAILARDLKMIDGEPDIRRDYFNELMFHVKPEAQKISNNYQKALKQRNQCLKNKRDNSETALWTKEVSGYGLELSLQQYDFFKSLKAHVKDYIANVISDESFNFLEGLDVSFSKGWERTKKLEESLEDCLDKDRAIGYTSKGPHRMDFTFNINKKRAASNLSRGQLKILILLIFLSNYNLLKELNESEIILIVDDLSSELDDENLTAILQEILKINHQIILTGIEGDEILNCLKKLTNFTQINI